MNIPIESYIPSGAGLLATIIGLAGMWTKFQGKVERLEEDRTENRRQIDAFWRWKEEHEKLDIDTRENLTRDIARLDAGGLVVNEQLKNIVAILNEIKLQISDFRKNVNENRNP